MFQSPGAILVKLGPLTIRWYGLMIALGFLSAAHAASRLARRWGLDPDRVVNMALVAFIGGILGARLYFVALSWDYFSVHPEEIIAIWKGGGSIHGGVIGGLVAGSIYCRMNRMPLLTCWDIGGVVTALGQAIGRWGNFFNSEAFGRPVPPDFPLKLFIPPEARPASYENVDYFHPTFLYESIWDLTVFAVLYFVVADKLKPFPGMCFLLYLASYSVGRLLIEPLRTDSIFMFGMPAPIIVSALSLVVAVIGMLILYLKYQSASQARS